MEAEGFMKGMLEYWNAGSLEDWNIERMGGTKAVIVRSICLLQNFHASIIPNPELLLFTFFVGGIGFFSNKAIVPLSHRSLALKIFDQLFHSVFEFVCQFVPRLEFHLTDLIGAPVNESS